MTIQEFLIGKTLSAVQIPIGYNIIINIRIGDSVYGLNVDTSQISNVEIIDITNFTLDGGILSANGISIDTTKITMLGMDNEEPYIELDWDYPIYSKRIVAPIQLVMDDFGIKMYGWFQLKGLPVINKNDIIYLYCTEILPEHQSIVNAYAGIITIENKP